MTYRIKSHSILFTCYMIYEDYAFCLRKILTQPIVNCLCNNTLHQINVDEMIEAWTRVSLLRNKSSHDILMGYHGDSLTFNVRSKFIFSILSIDGFVSFYLDCMDTDANITSKLQFSRWIKMTSSNGNILRVTNALCGEFSGHPWIPRTKASGAEFWCFYLSTPEPTVEQTMVTPVIWDAIALIMTSL